MSDDDRWQPILLGAPEAANFGSELGESCRHFVAFIIEMGCPGVAVCDGEGYADSGLDVSDESPDG